MPVVWRFSIAQGKNHCSLQSIDRLTRCRRKTTTTTPLKVFQWKQNLINPSVQHKTFHRSVLQWTKRKTRKNRTWLLTHLPSCGHHVWNSPRHSSSPINPKLKLQALGNKEKEGKLFCSCCFFCSWSESPQGLPISYQKLTKKYNLCCLWNPKNSAKQQMSESLLVCSASKEICRQPMGTSPSSSSLSSSSSSLYGEHLCSNACPGGPLFVVPVLREAVWSPLCPVQLLVGTGSGRNFGGWWYWFLFFFYPVVKKSLFWIFSVKSLLWCVIIN